jgi:uncharacterized protein YjiS (DUF1127 family)
MTQIHDQGTSSLWQNVGSAVSGWMRGLSSAFENARARSALRSEFDRLDQAGELDHVLNDIGLSRYQLPTLYRNHSGSARRLADMLKRLRIEVSPRAQNGLEMRAIQRTCLLCAVSGRCDRWVKSDSGEDPHEFCPNGLAFDQMVITGEASYNPKP